MSQGLHINATTIQALGVVAFVIAPAMWVGYKIGQWRGSTSGQVAGKGKSKVPPKPLEGQKP